MIKKRAGEKMTLAEAARRMSQLPVDGMIFNLRQMVDDFDTFEAPKDLKTVIITPMEHPTCSTVSDDQEGGARMACEYFLNHGHKNVYFVSGKKEALSSQCRMKGWRAALEARGIEPSELCKAIGMRIVAMPRALCLPINPIARRSSLLTTAWQTV